MDVNIYYVSELYVNKYVYYNYMDFIMDFNFIIEC